MEQLMTTEQAADYANLSVRSIWGRVYDGTLEPDKRVNDKMYWKRSTIDPIRREHITPALWKKGMIVYHGYKRVIAVRPAGSRWYEVETDEGTERIYCNIPLFFDNTPSIYGEKQR